MSEVRVETGVDDLISYLRTMGKVSLKETSSHLKIPEQTLQLWLDFLVEERVIGMEYKFTKPYIFLNQDVNQNSSSDAEIDEITLESFKEEFFSNARKKKMPEKKIATFWQNHLTNDIEKQKEFFIMEANKRSLENPNQLFARYKKRLLEM